jgi:hypothetical protein
MLGHAKASTTLDVYGHLYQESQIVAARVMDELVAPIRIVLPQGAKQEVER